MTLSIGEEEWISRRPLQAVVSGPDALTTVQTSVVKLEMDGGLNTVKEAMFRLSIVRAMDREHFHS